MNPLTRLARFLGRRWIWWAVPMALTILAGLLLLEQPEMPRDGPPPPMHYDLPSGQGTR